MSVKETASARRTPAKAPSASQPAAERRSAEAELRALVAAFAPTHARLVAAVRRWLRKRLPAAHEVIYEYRDSFVVSFSPDGHGYEGALAIRGGADGVSLYFNRGKELPDPARLLQGSGKQVRALDVAGASTLARPEVARLVDEAIARSGVAYGRAGRGSVVVRETTARRGRTRS